MSRATLFSLLSQVRFISAKFSQKNSFSHPIGNLYCMKWLLDYKHLNTQYTSVFEIYYYFFLQRIVGIYLTRSKIKRKKQLKKLTKRKKNVLDYKFKKRH